MLFSLAKLSSKFSVAASPLSALTFAGYIFEDVPSRLPECIEFYLIQLVCLLGYFNSWPAVQAVYQSVTSSVSLSVCLSLSLCQSVSWFILQSVSHSLKHVFPSFLRCSAEFPFQCTLIESLTCLCATLIGVCRTEEHCSPTPPPAPLS